MGLTATARKRLERDRRKNGKILLPIEFDEVHVVEVLISAGYLHPNDADHREKIRIAIEKLLARLAALDADRHA
jgi:hypothetical protein